MINEKLDYLAVALWKRLLGKCTNCPNCGSERHEVEDRKYLITDLRRCLNCRLMYRSPSDSEYDNEHFYQSTYKSGFATTLPDDDELNRLKAANFSSTSHDYRDFIAVLGELGLEHGSQIFDYGCSWGYGSWQLSQAGFNVVSYEISRPRAQFAAEKLGVRMIDLPLDLHAPARLVNKFDCFFSSHVFEHLPRPSKVIELAQALLKPGGYFVAFTPNGSDRFRSFNPAAWHRFWGKMHPNLIDDQFWKHAAGDRPILLDTSPVDRNGVNALHRCVEANGGPDLSGNELMCIVRF